jgi:hypothetical protein
MNLGVGFKMTGDLAAAKRAFSAALLLRPGSPDEARELRDVELRARASPIPP